MIKEDYTVDYKKYVATILDFPKSGIVFRDITPLMQDGEAYKACIDDLIDYAKSRQADLIIGPEARGFLFGCPVAYGLNVGFAPIRKPGKLPRETKSCSYDLEYGSNTLHMHVDAIQPGQRVLIVDDLLATGGTLKAACQLVESLGGVVAGIACVIELEELHGRALLEGYDVKSLMTY